MKCKDCLKFDSYESQGGEAHWFVFGFCHKKQITRHLNDRCEKGDEKCQTEKLEPIDGASFG
jgi:hypothetical protein